MSMRLYEIADQYQFLLMDLYDEETGVVNETALSKLNELTDPLETKCINITRIFKEIDAEREAIKKEKEAMTKRESSLKNQVESLKNYLLINMERCQINEIKCPQFVIKIQRNPPKVQIDDESKIDNEYKKVSVELDIQKIKDDLKNGVFIEGARLVQGNSLRIK